MDLVSPSSGLLFWMTLVFLIVFFILRKWGFPVILKMSSDRKEYIDGSIRKAKEAYVNPFYKRLVRNRL